METKELLKRVRRIEIKTRGLSKQIFSGEYHSAFKGRGMSFSEVREYQYGDDVRNIDWNVTARFRTPFIKVFEEERELTMMLLVDISKSSLMGSIQQRKKDLITEICAVLSFSAIHNNDKVGIILFSDEIELFVPAKKGKSHILRIIRELLEFEPKQSRTNIKLAWEYFNSVIKKRSICFMLSDFIDDQYDDALSIAARKHDVIGIKIFDALDMEIPDVGLVQMNDSETGLIKWMDTSSASLRSAYKEQADHYRSYFKQSFVKCGSDTMEIRTDDAYINTLLKFFKKRS